MADDAISVEVTPEKIREMSDAEKLSLLIEISFQNHAGIQHLSKTLNGNGVPGLCEQVRSTKRNLAWLWASFGAATGIFGTIGAIFIEQFLKHLAGK